MHQRRYGSVLLAFALAACGGGEPGDDGGGDGAPDSGGECRAGAMASTDRLLPIAVGNIWRYQVTDQAGVDPPSVKRQEITEEMTPAGETEPVLVQVTTKSTGQTVNWLRPVGDAMVRVQQEDYDADGLLERTTVYEPYKLRLDETAERLALGNPFEESYTSIVYDPQGLETGRTDIVDQWEVTSLESPCDTPWGQLSCVRIHRERLVGGIAVKDYYFARGYGKVREVGGQLEELTDCSLQ